MKISVCIPTYGMNGKGGRYLQQNLSSIMLQNARPYEIVISDHSLDESVEKVALQWKDYLNVKYFRNEEKVGNISANLNKCIELSSGDIIDFMLQDDYYFQPNSLKRRIENLGSSQWAVSSTIHLDAETNQFHWHLIPMYREDIYLGYNSIGSPSLLTMKREKAPLFDENLFLLTDCDYYKQLRDLFGFPTSSGEITVVSCMWPGQSQKFFPDEKKQREISIVKNKYEK